MCACFDLAEFVCFFTFFITAIVAVLFVNYFLIYLDFALDDKAKMFYFCRCIYFLLLTFLGCLVFAGVQRRSICLLKWPSRLLVILLTIGLVSLTFFLWTLDRVHKQSVRDLEEKTVKLSIVLILILIYFLGIQQLIAEIQSPRPSLPPLPQPHPHHSLGRRLVGRGIFINNINNNANYIYDQSDHSNHPNNLMDIFRSKTHIIIMKKSTENSTAPQQFNVASNGVNYYKLLLEGSSHSQRVEKKYSLSSSSIASIAEV